MNLSELDSSSPYISQLLISGALVLVIITYRFFAVPAELRHLPRVSILRLLVSYLTVEMENHRIERLLMPFAERGEGIVVVWALGRWMVHILDKRIARAMLDDLDSYPKELPPDDLLLWKFIGTSNIMLQNGDGWQKHSRMVRGALSQSLPIEQFINLSRKVLGRIGKGGKCQFDDMAQRFALDAVGTTVLGHDFDSIENESSFVREYNAVMYGIANPVYLLMPFLERWRPRRTLMARMDGLVSEFQTLLEKKKSNPGDDVMTYMLKEPDMTDVEYRDNMVLLFIAGHDTSAGGLTSLIYYLAKHEDVQEQARREVLSTLEHDSEPTIKQLQSMPFVSACIREALRINTPISYIVPRASSKSTRLGKYIIPPYTSLIVNLYAIHHSPVYWQDPNSFDPGRFLRAKAGSDDTWLPFAIGPRQCPARNFAIYEQRVLVTMLLREYRWSLPHDSPHANHIINMFSPFALSVPHDLHVIFKKIS